MTTVLKSPWSLRSLASSYLQRATAAAMHGHYIQAHEFLAEAAALEKEADEMEMFDARA